MTPFLKVQNKHTLTFKGTHEVIKILQHKNQRMMNMKFRMMVISHKGKLGDGMGLRRRSWISYNVGVGLIRATILLKVNS